VTARRFLVGALGVYKRFVSPLLPPACRFWPTCAEYASQAIELHGVRRGSWLALKRIGRCHPFCHGGYDPVPPVGADGADARPVGQGS
jgi:putative membrane protein insertion efficiency factor